MKMMTRKDDSEAERLIGLELGWGKRIFAHVTDPKKCVAEMRKVIEEIAQYPQKEALMHAVNITGLLSGALPDVVTLAWANEVQKWAQGDEIPPGGAEC